MLVDHASLREHGFFHAPGVVSEKHRRELSRDVDAALARGRPGDRRGLEREAVRKLLSSPIVRDLAAAVLGPEAFAVKATLFDKTRTANWLVAWHQDLSVALRQRIDVAGFGPWSRKQGTWHAPAPAPVLERMLAIRMHVDDATTHGGALRVLHGSHVHGRLAPGEIVELARTTESVECVARAGDALVMRPLLVHASSRSTSAEHRRVVHIELAAEGLPMGLEWIERIPVGAASSCWPPDVDLPSL